MRAVIQRVKSAHIEIEQENVGAIGGGLLIFLGIGKGDFEADAQLLWNKIFRLRIFADASGKTNLSLSDVGKDVLIVSQFTLFANCKKGNRPSFFDAKEPDEACRLYEKFIALAQKDVNTVQTGRFGADMSVSLVNDGPFTICLDTDTL